METQDGRLIPVFVETVVSFVVTVPLIVVVTYDGGPVTTIGEVTELVETAVVVVMLEVVVMEFVVIVVGVVTVKLIVVGYDVELIMVYADGPSGV